MLRISLAGLLVVRLVSGCGLGDKKESAQDLHMPEGLNRETELKYRQYAVQGRLLYKQHCANCHQDDGSGLANLIPPLANSDYFEKNLEETVCIIRNGIKGPMVVNGKEYNQPMPPNPELRTIEIAEIVTYITNAWGNQGELISVQKTQSWLNNCEQGE